MREINSIIIIIITFVAFPCPLTCRFVKLNDEIGFAKYLYGKFISKQIYFVNIYTFSLRVYMNHVVSDDGVEHSYSDDACYIDDTLTTVFALCRLWVASK